ncbi:MAG: thiol-disulfide isomerase/thioredoxin [Porticoccus sp.]|jgi:thiol-disulfide isomerase/thioredoxin
MDNKLPVSLVILWLGLLSLLFLIASCQKNDVAYTLTDGQKLNFYDLRGRIVLINYWAIWCKPCRTEIPELNALQKKWGNEVVVLGVNYDGIQGDDLKMQAKNMGINFPVLVRDPRAHFGVAPSGVLPETLVIDRHGALQAVLLGPQTTENLLPIINSSSATN